MRGSDDLAGQALARHVAHITIARELNPGPAFGLIEDRDGLAEQRLGVERRIEARLAPDGQHRGRNLAPLARHVAGRVDPPAQRVIGEVGRDKR